MMGAVVRCVAQAGGHRLSAARIGRIRMKTGGAEVRVLRNERKDADGRENWCGEVVRSAKAVASFSEPGAELCGFVVIGLYTDGMHSMGYRLDEKRSVVPGPLLPSYVAELIRQDIVTRRKFDDMFERV